ncbi:tetratricopeptide repeat protein 4-like [Amphiura filiformis]|uniref:tetratricopeptide repeat protein 4-like n=1 Tax=Amphiura filiformis TaxID=82378 RepID=UPI003B213964
MAERQIEKDVSDLAKELDEKIDKHIDSLPRKPYKGGLDPDNWREEIEKIPIFMTKPPTEEDIAASPDLQALQALKFAEDDTPEELASSHKDDGNAHFKRKLYKRAIMAYTEGLQQKCDNVDLNTVLYTNRAAANFHLGNHRSSLNDATEAIQLKPSHVKALLRAAQCCLKLQEYTQCIQWCDKGLQIDSNDKKFLDVRAQAVKEKKTLEKDRRKKKASEKKELARLEKIMMAIKERNIRFAALPTEDGDNVDEEGPTSEEKLYEARIMAALATNHVSGASVELDEEGASVGQ